jgi:hypothetical protein
VGAALPTKEETMIRTLMFAAVSAAALLLSPIAFAQQTGGTADEAKAMLMKAVAAVKADKAKALDMFNKGEGGFLDRDLRAGCNLEPSFLVCALMMIVAARATRTEFPIALAIALARLP